MSDTRSNSSSGVGCGGFGVISLIVGYVAKAAGYAWGGVFVTAGWIVLGLVAAVIVLVVAATLLSKR